MKVSPINNYNSHTSYGAGEYRSGKGVQKNLGEIQKRLQYGVGPSKTFKLSKGAEKTAARAFFVAVALLLFGLFSHANKESRVNNLLQEYGQDVNNSLTVDDIKSVKSCTLDGNEKKIGYNRQDGTTEYPTYVSQDVAKDICKGLPLKFKYDSYNNGSYYSVSGNLTRSYNPEKEQSYMEKIKKSRKTYEYLRK